MKLTRLTGATGILIMCAALVCLNFIAARINVKADLTRGRLYSLSAGSRAIAARIDDEAVIQYFFSRSSETLPVMVKDYGRRVQELLTEFAALSPRLRLEVYDPRPDSDEEEMAVRYGINGAQAGDGTAFFMGAALQYQGETHAIPFFDPRREAFLEYDIASMLARAREAGGRKVVGLLSGMALTSQEFTQPLMLQQASAEDWLFVKELERTFETRVLTAGLQEIPGDIDLLLVLHPLGVSEKTEYAIEQFILKGGKAALVVDPSARSVPDTSPAAQSGRATGSRSNLPRLFKTIGVNYDDQLVAADSRYSTRVSSRSGPVQYPFWLTLDGAAFSRKQIITALLESMLLIEPGFFKPEPGAGVEFTPLISTSSASPGTIRSSQLALVTPQNADRYQPADAPLALAALATGKFRSSFAGKPEGSQYAGGHLAQADQDAAVLLVGDVDFLNNSYSLRNLNFLGQNIIQPLNHNIAFLTNALEFLTGSTELISIRSRGTFQRPFERVADIEKKAQAKWYGVEQELTDKIQDLQRRLNQLQSARSQDNQVTLSAEQQAEIDRFKIEQLEFKRKRRDVRKNLRQDIERLGTILAAVNITVVPSLVLLAGLYIYFRRAGGRPLLGKRRRA